VDVFQKQCFAVRVLRVFFVCVLWCFVCVFQAIFTAKQHKTTDQQIQIHKTHTQRTKYDLLCAIHHTAQYRAAHLSLTQKMSTKRIHKTLVLNTSKTLQNTRKERTAKHCFYKKHLQNTTKHP